MCVGEKRDLNQELFCAVATGFRVTFDFWIRSLFKFLLRVAGRTYPDPVTLTFVSKYPKCRDTSLATLPPHPYKTKQITMTLSTNMLLHMHANPSIRLSQSNLPLCLILPLLIAVAHLSLFLSTILHTQI